MSGWRKNDPKSKPRSNGSRADSSSAEGSRTSASKPGIDQQTPESNSAGWRRSGSATNANSGSSKKTGWRGGRTVESPTQPSSKRYWLLTAVVLMFTISAILFLKSLWEREKKIEVVLFQRGVDASQLDSIPLGLMPLSQQWSGVNRDNCRVSLFHQFEDNDRETPLLMVVQSEVDAQQVKKDVNAILLECLGKMRPNTSALVVLDLISSPKSIPLLNYLDPARSVGQSTDFYAETEAVWGELLQSAEVKSREKNLMLFVANSASQSQAWSAPELNGSVLQNFLIDALSNPECDANKDYNVTVDELETFVKQRVADWVKARRAAIQIPKILIADETLRQRTLYKRVSNNWINQYVGRRRQQTTPTATQPATDGIEIVQRNWNKIDTLWAQYEILLNRKTYRWAPERLTRIAHGLTMLEHYAERVDIEKQPSASRLLKTVELEFDACPKIPPSRIDFNTLGVDFAVSGVAQAEYAQIAQWGSELPKYLEPLDGAADRQQGQGAEAKQSAKDKSSNGSASADSVSSGNGNNQGQGGNSDSTAAGNKDVSTQNVMSATNPRNDLTQMDHTILSWLAACQFPSSNSPENFRQFMDLGLSKADTLSPSPTLQFLKLLRNDSYWFKTSQVFDTPTKTRFAQTLGPSLKRLDQWMKLIFTQRRPDAVLKLAGSLDEISTEVQNQIVDRWLVGKLPGDDVLGGLEVRLSELDQSLRTWEQALDARDEYYLFRPYLISWLVATSEFADNSDQTALRQATEKIKQLDEMFGNFGEGSDQVGAAQLVERWSAALEEYRRLGFYKHREGESKRSEASFQWLRVTRGLPIALDEIGRRELRSKMVTYMVGKADINVGKGDLKSGQQTDKEKDDQQKRTDFLNDLSGKFPLDSLVRAGELPQEDRTFQSRWLRSPDTLFYEAIYQQLSQAASAKDRGDTIWSLWVRDHSSWLQKLVLQRMSWGNGSDGTESLPYYQRLAQAVGVIEIANAGSGTQAEETASLDDELNSTLTEVKEKIGRFRFTVKGDVKATYEADSLPDGGLQYPVKLGGELLSTWGEVREINSWVDASGRGFAAAVFQANLDGSDSFSFNMQEFSESGIRGEIVGTFRGNRFGQPFIREPASRQFVETSLERNLMPAILSVEGIKAPRLNVVFAIDISNSMNQAAPVAEGKRGTRLGQAKAIMTDSLTLLKKEYLEKGIVGQVNVGLVLFSKDVSAIPVEDILTVLEKFENYIPLEGQGETKLVDGYQRAIEMLDKKTTEECLVIGITDGIDTSENKGLQAKDINAFLADKLRSSPHIQCLLLQAASKDTFVGEMVNKETDEKLKSEAESHWTEQWKVAQESLGKLEANSRGQFVWYKENQINSKNMMDQINRILPGTEVVVDGTVAIEDRRILLSQNASLPTGIHFGPRGDKSAGPLQLWSEGISGWGVTVKQKNRRVQGDNSGRRGFEGRYGPFPVWGGENIKLVFDQSNGSLYREGRDERPEIHQEMLGEQWIMSRLLKGPDGLSVNIGFGCDVTRSVERPELIFVEQSQNGKKIPLSCDFVYKLGLKVQHAASFLEVSDHWIERKTATERVRMDHRIWTVRRSSALSRFYLPAIGPIAEASNSGDSVELGDAWQGEKLPEVKVRRYVQQGSKKEQVEIYVSGENATEWFLTLVGNVWKEVNVKISTDRKWIRKTYTITEGFSGQTLQAVLISAEQLRQAGDESAARKDGLIEMFEFPNLLESSW